jgi:hypothetical protein
MSLTILKNVLASLPPGPIDPPNLVLDALIDAWEELDGSSAHSMDASKLSRAANLSWAPPKLEFRIERHGGANMGSKSADSQTWTVDVNKLECNASTVRGRRLQPFAARLKTGPLVDTIIQAVGSGRNVPGLTVNIDGTLSIEARRFVPTAGKPLQTAADQRRRFREELLAQLKLMGWSPTSPQSYRFQRMTVNRDL